MNVEYFTKRNTRPIDETTRGDPQRARQIRDDNNFHRKHVLACLTEGRMTLAEFRELRETDARLNCLHVRHVVYACVGKYRGNRYLKELAPLFKMTADQFGDKRVAKVGPEQWFRLIGRVDSARQT